VNNVGRAIARQLWWAIAHPTSFMLNFSTFYDAIDVGRSFFIHLKKGHEDPILNKIGCMRPIGHIRPICEWFCG
jgi:hypothetical protein